MENVFPWIVAGLLLGWLASVVVRGGYGVVGDMVLGTTAAVLGGAIVHTAGVRTPIGGALGSTCMAFVSAALLLASLRLFRRVRAR